MFVLCWLELLVLAGHLESGLGFKGANYELVVELEFLTRGGNVPFILGIDANEEPEAWDNLHWGEKKYLEHLNAEIVTVRNSDITCVGAKNLKGGSNIDYYIMSTCLIGGIRKVEADFQVPFAPHYGIELLLEANPMQVLTRQLVKPDMPNAIGKIDKGEFYETNF